MSSVARIGDVTIGHQGFGQQLALTGSDNVFVESIGVVRLTDVFENHSDGHSTHSGIVASGSNKVFVNNLPIARIGDPLTCSSIIGTGSSKVIVSS